MNRLLFILLLAVYSVPALSQTTDFSYQTDGNNLCAPVNVQFTQTSPGNPVGYLWDFGNGERSNSPNPAVMYSSPGNYRVRLIVVYNNTTAEKVRTISITRGVNTSFTANREQLCNPGTITFTLRSSSNAVRHEWNFGDGSTLTSTGQSPVTHAYTEFGSYSVTLKSFNEAGCHMSDSSNIIISRPEVTGTRTPGSGCSSLQVSFQSSMSLPAGSSVSAYEWNFGDGTILRNGSRSVNHIYRSPGQYRPVLTITTRDGCSGQYIFDSVFVGRPLNILRAYTSDPVICGSEKARFVCVAPGATGYQWDFGNGNMVVTRDTFIERKFHSLGIQQVTVKPLYHDCPGSSSTLQVEVIGVIARFAYQNTCTDKRLFSFRNNSQGNISTLLWEIGAQRVPIRTVNFDRQFPPSGAYPVRLNISDAATGCTDSASVMVYTASPNLVNARSSACLKSQTRFRLERNYTNPNATYEWHVLGNVAQTGNQPDITFIADSLGIFPDNYVIIRNGQSYCPDTVRLQGSFKVQGPMLSFDMPQNICLSEQLSVVNSSRPFFPSDSITRWTWHFGIPGVTDHQYQPNPIRYRTHHIYPVSLSASDINGCSDTLTKRLNVRPMPFLWTIPKADTICQGQSSSFIAYTSDTLQWVTSQALAGLCNGCDSVQISPLQSSFIRIRSTNSFNCSSEDSISVTVVEPFTARASVTDTAICRNDKLQLDIEPRDKQISWTPAELMSNPRIHNPVISPPQTTLFTARLVDSYGCFNSEVNINVQVKSLPSVELGSDRHLPYFSQFTLQPRYSTNTRRYLWTPADSLSCSTCPNPSGIASSARSYTVTAISDSGCVAKDNINIYVECKNANILVPGAFTPNNDRLNDILQPVTRGIQYISRYAIFDRMGNMVFEAKNFIPNKQTHGWDGRFRGTLQPGGAYVYFVEAICETGQSINAKGSVILIR